MIDTACILICGYSKKQTRYIEKIMYFNRVNVNMLLFPSQLQQMNPPHHQHININQLPIDLL